MSTMYVCMYVRLLKSLIYLFKRLTGLLQLNNGILQVDEWRVAASQLSALTTGNNIVYSLFVCMYISWKYNYSM